jgi:hypothetical protein
MKTTSEFHIIECIAQCKDRVKNGFSVLEYSVPLQFADEFRNKIYDEFYQYGILSGWTMKHYPDGKMAKTEEIDGVLHKTYYLRYTL